MTEEYVVGICPNVGIPAGGGAKGECPFLLVVSIPAVAGLSELYRGNADSVNSYGEVLDVMTGFEEATARVSGAGCA